ncbi:flagellar filament capping protein FliD [Hydrogenophaga pseudoflava]|uniref:flagellar filament capping protein FliD n=1 Tax=Hydrogenophaga pseudoflava TaxID=47421 RepID=UPI0027E3CC52|nr:flagellar filament capping protein FliD [Hydrogenophaga pseudoflava]MDQ7743596.1 flagellar filament capping protein FliD [Hydrogenophaga pseudoflava]
MATISSPGIASGLDIQSIVSQLVALEKAPLTQLKTQATSLQTKLSTMGTIKSQVSALGDAAAKLSKDSGWNPVKATSSNPSAIGVTVKAGAPATSITMEVQNLAKAQSTASAAVTAGTAMGTGSMTIQLGQWSGSSFTAGSGTPVTIDIDAGQDTLSSIAAKINESDAGVSATVLRDASGERLLVRSKATGEENAFRITVADDDGDDTDAAGLSRLAFSVGNANGMSRSQSAENAQATINNVPIVSASNTLSGTLTGMTIQLSQETTAPVTIDVSNDTEAIRSNIKTFVDAYNTLNSTLASALRYDEATKTAGPLQGDATTVGLQNALRGMMRSVSASTPYSRLSDVGIEIKSGGKLEINATKMDAALDNLDDLKALFTSTSNDATATGFGWKIKTFAEGLIDADGTVTNKTDALQASIKRNTLDQERVNDKAARAEKRFLAQYNAMDAAVGSLNGLSAFVSQQITLWNKG